MVVKPPWAEKAIADQSNRPLGDAPRQGREHFIPVRHQTLLDQLLQRDELTPLERCQLRDLCAVMRALIHREFHEQLLTLTRVYAPFDPDDDTRSLESYCDAELRLLQRELFETLKRVLRSGNYRQLSKDEIEQALEVASEWGLRLHVDFSVFDRLEVYCRGEILGSIKRRPWYKLFRPVTVQVPMYQRLVIVFSLRHTRGLNADVDLKAIYLKLFKNIPKVDVDILLPASRIRMTLLDRGKIILPTLSGVIATIIKIIKGAVFAALSGTIWGLIGLLTFIIGTIGYGIRSFLGYLHTKDRYQLHLTRNLYYQNLDNNAGVFYRLIDDAEEQEIREMLLAYYVAWKLGPATGWTLEELDREAEKLLKELLGVDVDFEVDDAAAKLLRYGMASQTDDGRIVIVSPETILLQRRDLLATQTSSTTA
jgi:hypothetical protein